jgi:hypothetical protein
MERWAARLPLGKDYERCVSIEWLYEGGWMMVGPTMGSGNNKKTNGVTVQSTDTADEGIHDLHGQIVLDDSCSGDDDDDAEGPVLRLALPDTVLQWNEVLDGV